MSNSTFDRVRTRAISEPSMAGVDVQGKSALFSRDKVHLSLGAVAITCSDSTSRRLPVRQGAAAGAAEPAPAGPAPRLPVVDALPRL